MMRRSRRAGRAPAFHGVGLLAGLFVLSGCGSSQEGSVVLKTPVDLKTIGSPPPAKGLAPGRPQKGKVAIKTMIAPG